jgi:hypothetical protein
MMASSTCPLRHEMSLCDILPEPLPKIAPRNSPFIYIALLTLLQALRLPAAVSTTADDLLTLKEQQAEQVSTLDTRIDTIVEANGRTAVSHTHMMMDKAKGAMRFQRLDDKDQVKSEIMVQGTSAYYHSAAGQWVKLPMDDQTRGTLESLGVPMESPQTGLAGFEKQDAAQASTTQAASGRQVLSAKAKQRISKRVARKKKHLNFERRHEMDDEARHLRGIRHKPGIDAKNLPYDEEDEKIDETNGMKMERSRWVRAEHFPGGQDKIPREARHRQADDGGDMVETEHHQVTKVMKAHGVDLPEEMEVYQHTARGKISRHTKWTQVKVNEGIEARAFERK